MDKTNKLKRKEQVKQNRKEFKKDPGKYIKENVIQKTLTYWKQKPLHAIWTFTSWVAIYMLLFGLIQAVNNDMIYCDSTINQYDGKVMYVYNDFVKYYNQKAQEMQETHNPLNIQEQENKVANFNEQYKMYCTYDLKRWNNETITNRIKTTSYGLQQILKKAIIRWE